MCAFMRGINVGNRRPKSAELVAAVDGPELSDVTTYQASGNLLFRADDAVAPAELERTLEQRLRQALGYEVVCFVRTVDELRDLVADIAPAGDGEKHEVIFYRTDPGDEARAELSATKGDGDTLRARDRETIWTHVGGLMDSPLAALTPKPGAPVTTVRTAGTVERILAKLV